MILFGRCDGVMTVVSFQVSATELEAHVWSHGPHIVYVYICESMFHCGEYKARKLYPHTFIMCVESRGVESDWFIAIDIRGGIAVPHVSTALISRTATSENMSQISMGYYWIRHGSIGLPPVSSGLSRRGITLSSMALESAVSSSVGGP